MWEAELDGGVDGTGIPASAPKVLARKFGVVDSARLAWLGSGELPPAVITREWSTQEWVHFIEGMPETLATEQLAQLDDAYQLTGTPNGEIAMRWYPLAVPSGYPGANEAIVTGRETARERVGKNE